MVAKEKVDGMSRSLTLDNSERADLIRFCARFCGSNAASTATRGPIRLKFGREATLNQVNTIIRYVARSVNREEELLGSTAVDRAQIAQWMSFAMNLIDGVCPSSPTSHLRVLEKVLTTRTYFVGNHISLADIALFWIVAKDFQSLDGPQKTFPNVCRWFDLVQRARGIIGSQLFTKCVWDQAQWKLL